MNYLIIKQQVCGVPFRAIIFWVRIAIKAKLIDRNQNILCFRVILTS